MYCTVVSSPKITLVQINYFLYDISKRVVGVEEIILATNPTMEGEATGPVYPRVSQKNRLQDTPLPKITRIGHGLPVEQTLSMPMVLPSSARLRADEV